MHDAGVASHQDTHVLYGLGQPMSGQTVSDLLPRGGREGRTLQFTSLKLAVVQ